MVYTLPTGKSVNTAPSPSQHDLSSEEINVFPSQCVLAQGWCRVYRHGGSLALSLPGKLQRVLCLGTAESSAGSAQLWSWWGSPGAALTECLQHHVWFFSSTWWLLWPAIGGLAEPTNPLPNPLCGQVTTSNPDGPGTPVADGKQTHQGTCGSMPSLSSALTTRLAKGQEPVGIAPWGRNRRREEEVPLD